MKIKRSNYFIPFKKDSEFQGAVGRMLKGAFVHQQASGMYIWLNLGLRVLEKVTKVIDEEHEKISAQKMLMPILQEASLWKISGRYQEYGPEMLKMKDRHDHEFIYGPSAEEMFASLLTKWPLNKSSLPLILYNVQWKFRDEIRPRFGVVRSREFLMKDAYSFDKTPEDMMKTYETMFGVYSNIFVRLGLNVCTFSSDVGIMGGSLSHEFILQSVYGETKINCKKWPAQPLAWDERDNAVLDEESDTDKKYAEIGHVYALGDKYTKAFKLLNPGTQQPLQMGCYGIGVSRLVGILFENNEHDLGIVSPFKYALVTLQEECMEVSDKVFQACHEIAWDDRKDVMSGVKFAEADLLHANTQIIIGNKELAEGQVSIKEKGEKRQISLEELFNMLGR